MTNSAFQFIPTRATAEAHQTIDQVIEARGVAILKASSGMGKTVLLRTYAAATAGVLLYPAEVVNTPRSMVQALLGRLGVVWNGGTRVGLMVFRHVAAEAGCRAVLVDDAQRLTRTTFDMLRAIHEDTGMAVVLAGSDRIGRVLVGKQEELAHRVTAVNELSPLAFEDVLSFVRAGHSRKRRTYWECVAMARSLLCASGGNFRRLVQVLRDARNLARARHRAVTPRFVSLAASKIRGVA